jgi:hypothetical protein
MCKLSLIDEQCHAVFLAIAAAFTKVCDWCDDQVKGFVFFGGDTDKAIAAKSSTPVSVQYQSSWEFCIHCMWYKGFTALHPEHCLPQAVVAYILHSFMGRNHSIKILCTL